MKLQKAVKEETIKVAIGEAICVGVMLLIWFIIHLLSPTVSFNVLTIILAFVGGAVAVANFLLLGLFVQKATSIDSDETTKQFYRSTYRKRRLLLFIWGILSFVIPILCGFSVIHGIAGVIPLLFPTYIIRIVGAIDALKCLNKKTDTTKSNAKKNNAAVSDK